jgi:protein arginine kinase
MRRGGRDTDVVLSSRVRLARNLRRYEFPHRATTSDLLTIRHRVWQGLHATGESSGGLSDARLLPFEEFTGWERQSLIDRYITSREHIAEEIGRGVAANADASLSVLGQRRRSHPSAKFATGLATRRGLSFGRSPGRHDGKLLRFARRLRLFRHVRLFDGLPHKCRNRCARQRMLHLPALEIVGKMERSRKWAEEKQLALRGSFGEGSRVWGHMHQLSNQVTLGVDEAEVLLDTESAARELCEMERRARASLAATSGTTKCATASDALMASCVMRGTSAAAKPPIACRSCVWRTS